MVRGPLIITFFFGRHLNYTLDLSSLFFADDVLEPGDSHIDPCRNAARAPECTVHHPAGLGDPVDLAFSGCLLNQFEFIM